MNTSAICPPRRALLVEPDADTQLLYGSYLASQRWEVMLATGGPEALARAIAYRPDVIVSETQLPGFAGVTLCELLQRDVDTSQIPLVFVTADSSAANLAKAEAWGAALVIIKPCVPDALLDALDAVVRRSQRLRHESTQLHTRAKLQIAKAEAAFERVERGRVSLRKAHRRHETKTPPSPPPTLRCPICDRELRYLRSHVGGVSIKHSERWDHFVCPTGCGRFEYRVRTRRLLKVAE